MVEPGLDATRRYALCVLMLTVDVRDRMVAHCLSALPLEGCGLLLGSSGDSVVDVVGTRNAAGSAVLYEVDPKDHLAVDRDARERGLEVVGAFHSHTHTDAWPSATDVAAAVDPDWHWVVISLRHFEPVVRSFRIVEGNVGQEPVELA
jgi:proteasome lid subunit RPN8/RPN11